MKSLRALGLYAVLTVTLTWPYAANLWVMEVGDPAFFAWEVGWTVHALGTDPLQLPHGNIFHPLQYTLGLDEPVFGTTLLALPLALSTDNAALLFNFLRPGSRFAAECKAFSLSSWSFQSSIDKAVSEVYGGFQYVDPTRSGTQGFSILATTPDLVGQPDMMRRILEAIDDLPEAAYADRSVIYLLPKTSQEYEDWAYWVIRRFKE